MDKISVIPLSEVDGIKLGTKRAEVRKIFGEAKEFKKSKFSKNTTDDFGFCHVFYNVNDECEAIEIFNDVKVYIQEKLVFPTSIDKAEMVLGNLKKEEDSYISVDKSVGIYAPNGKMESILFAVKGYY